MATMRRVTSPEVPEPPPKTWSNCRVMGNQVFIAGMVAREASGRIGGGDSMYQQARIVFAKIAALMRAAGGTMDDVIKVNIYVTDIARREEVWKARAEVFTGDFPCSTLVEVAALAEPAILVEVEAVGFLGAG
jgi:enamine deaminase RidA (YjgF/YER057c/UK114 family)